MAYSPLNNLIYLNHIPFSNILPLMKSSMSIKSLNQQKVIIFQPDQPGSLSFHKKYPLSSLPAQGTHARLESCMINKLIYTSEVEVGYRFILFISLEKRAD